MEILDCVYTAADNNEVIVQISLDLSAAFDAVDHEILLERLQTKFGVEGMLLTWLLSYLDGRTQYVKIGQHLSTAIQLEIGIPQGSVPGPILFAVYASPVADVIASHGVQYHHVDDTQLRHAMRADNTSVGLSFLAACTADIRQWYMQNGLQLNLDKSEVLIVGTAHQLRTATSSMSPTSVCG